MSLPPHRRLGRVLVLLSTAALFVASPAAVLAQETEEGGAAEVGPPWTYQMAKITIVMLVLLGVAIGASYHRLVVRRRRGDV